MSGLTERYVEPAPRPIRRRWGLVAVMIILVLTGLAVGRHLAMGGLSAREIDNGTALLAAALSERDPAKIEAAHEHFRDAASVSIVDMYPAFLLSISGELARWSGGPPTDPREAVIGAMWRRDWQAALDAASKLGEPGTKPRVYYERLIHSLRAQSAATKAS